MAGRKKSYEQIDKKADDHPLLVQRMRNSSVKRKGIQRKNEVSEPGDVDEQQADQIASQFSQGQDLSLDEMQMQLSSSSSGEDYSGGEDEMDAAFDYMLGGTKGAGQPLSEDALALFEGGMGTDFSEVRVHTSTVSDELSKSINAKAFTVGNDIHFSSGTFDTTSSQGRELIAHELVHTKQQSGGAKRKIQRVIDSKDEKDIVRLIRPHFIRMGPLKRLAVLRILSKYSPEEIVEAWTTTRLQHDLAYFVDSFHGVSSFRKFSLVIAATFSAFEPDKRVNRIQSLTKGKISSSEAVRILYLMQGLDADNLDVAFNLEKDTNKPTKFDLFKMALPSDESERLQSELSYTKKVADRGSAQADIIEKIDEAALAIYEVFRVSPPKYYSRPGKNQEVERKEYAKWFGDVEIAPYDAIKAYYILEALSADELEEFGVKYSELYSKTIDNLPIEFLKSAEFGLKKVKDKEQSEYDAKTKENVAAYHFLYQVARPYRFLFNNPVEFADIAVKIAAKNADEKELEKDYLFEHREKKIEKKRDEHSSDLDAAKEKLKLILPKGFVPDADQLFFDAELQAVLNLIEQGNSPVMTNSFWIFKPGTLEVDKEYVLTVLTDLLDKRLKEASSLVNNGTQYAAAKLLLKDHPELAEVLIGAEMPQAGTLKLADEMEADENLISLYTQDAGIFKSLSVPELWWGTDDSNVLLGNTLSLVVSGGFGQKVAGFVGRHSTLKTDETLRKKGFENGTFKAPKDWDKNNLTSTAVQAGDITEDVLTAELIKRFPEKKAKLEKWPAWRKYAFAVLHIGDLLDLLQAGAYYMEGYMYSQGKLLPDSNLNIIKHAHVEDLNLMDVQRGMGGQIYGMEFEGDLNNQALLNVDVDERIGFAQFTSDALPIKSIHMQYPDFLFTSGSGHFNNLVATMHWPANKKSDTGSTDMKLDLLLTDMRYQDNGGMLFTMRTLKIQGLHVQSDKPLANYTQMNNWYKMLFVVLGFTSDVMSILMNSLQVAGQSMAPDMIKDIVDPLKNPGYKPGDELKTTDNPQKALSEFLLQRMSEDETLKIDFAGLLVEDMMFDSYGLIKSFESGPGNMTFSNSEIDAVTGEREMKFGFSGSGLKVDGADVSGMKTKQLGADHYGLDFYFSEPSSGDKKHRGRDMMSLVSLSQLSSENKSTQVSRLKKIGFDLSGMSGESLDIVGSKMGKLPFDSIKGTAEFKEEDASDKLNVIPSKVLVHLDYVNGINFFNLPFPADGAFRFETQGTSVLRGNMVDADIEVTLNSQADQNLHGWDIQEVKIVKMLVPELEARNFTIQTQQSTILLGEGGIIQQLSLSNFILKPGIKDKDTWDIHNLSMTTGGVDLKGIGIYTTSGIGAELDKFTGGSLNFGIVLGQKMDGDTLKQTTTYSFGGTNLNSSGTINYNGQGDQYDETKNPLSLTTMINMENNTLQGSYTTNTEDGKTRSSSMTLKTSVSSLTIPVLDVTSSDMHILAPEVSAHPLVLKDISADVSVDFNEFGDATKFSIISLKIPSVSTYGLLITDLKKHKNLVDLAQHVSSTIKGLFIENLTMEKRPFTDYEIEEMKRDKERKSLPDENRTFDFVHTKAGDNRIGYESADFPAVVKLAIGDSIAAEMTKAHSGAVWFEFVTKEEFTYSITDLDANGLIVKKNDEVMFKGDLDSEITSGGVKTEYIDTDMGLRRQTTYSVTTRIPLINVEELHIKSETLQFDIPETASKSKLQDINANVSIVVLEPSFKQQDDILAKSKSLKETAENTKFNSDKERRDALKQADIKAHSDITINIISLDIESITAYEAYLKTSGESKIHTDEKKDERYFFDTTQELELQENQAAIIRKLHAENAVFTLTGLEKQHFNLTAKKMSVGNDDVKGIEIGTTHFMSSKLKHILGSKENEIDKWSETGTGASLSVQKITFDGNTDKVYKVTITDPRMYLPQDGDAFLGTKGIKFVDPWGLISRINLEDPSHPEIPLFKAGSISIETIETDDGKGGKEYLKKIVIDGPVLSDLTMEGSYQVYDNAENTTIDFDSITFSGKIDGKIVITETKANLAKKTGDWEAENEQPVWNIDAMGADLTIEKAKFTLPLDDISKEGKKQHDKEKGWDAMDEEQLRIAQNEENRLEYNKHKFAFLDASYGTIDLRLFGETSNGYITTINVPGETEDQTGYYNLAHAIEFVNEKFDEKMNYWTKGEAEYVLDELYCREINGEYWLTAYEGFKYNKVVKLLEYTGNNNLVKVGDQEYVRLAALVNSIMHPQTAAGEPVGFGDILAALIEWKTGYGKQNIERDSKRQIEEWLNRAKDNMNPTLEMNIEIWESELREKSKRGLLQYFNLEKDGRIRLHMTAGLSEESNIPAVDPNQPNPRSLFPTVTLSPIADPFNPDQPQKGLEIPGFEFRFGENKKLTDESGVDTAKGILKSNGITLESAKFVYGKHISVYEDRMQHLKPDTLEAKNLKVKGFNLTLYRPPKEK